MIVGNKLTLNFPGSATQQLVGPNPRRVGLLIGPPSASTFFLTFGEGGSPLEGIRFNAGAYGPFLLQFDSPNDFITQAIWINSQGAALVFAYELVDRVP